VLDLIYNPARTRLLLDAQAKGIPHLGGLTMLVGQARAAAALFLGRGLPAQKERAVCKLLRSKMENIILIGMPGCGKTVIGQILAGLLGRPFLDTDRLIEEAAGMRIPQIFSAEGEGGFRRRESEILAQAGKGSGQVISTGGGCVTRAENLFYLRQNGRIVFVERKIDQLAREGRPLSAGNLEELYRLRLPLYRQFADLTVVNSALPEAAARAIEEAVDEIFGD